MPVYTTRQNLIDTLLAYGEPALADRIPSISPEEMDGIADRADHYAFQGMLFAKAVSLATVDVLEGRSRPLARTRRKFDRSKPPASDGSGGFRQWPEKFWGTIKERVERSSRQREEAERGASPNDSVNDISERQD